MEMKKDISQMVSELELIQLYVEVKIYIALQVLKMLFWNNIISFKKYRPYSYRYRNRW